MQIGYEDMGHFNGDYEHGGHLDVGYQGDVHMHADYHTGPPTRGNYQDEQNFHKIMEQREYHNLNGVQEQAYYNEQGEMIKEADYD